MVIKNIFTYCHYECGLNMTWLLMSFIYFHFFFIVVPHAGRLFVLLFKKGENNPRRVDDMQFLVSIPHH